MIKVGDKLLLDGKQIKVIIYNDCGGVYVSDNADDEKGIELTYEEAYEYLWLYEKHRADEAEKRADAAEAKWEKMKEQTLNTINSKDATKTVKQFTQSTLDRMEYIEKLERGEE